MASDALPGIGRFGRISVWRPLILGSVVVVFSACAENAIHDPEPQHSFVFGYIDMTNGPGVLLGVTLYRLSPEGGTPYVTFAIQEGTFYNANVPTGSYYLQEFRNVSRSGGRRQANGLPPQAKLFQLTVDKPGAFYFMGSFRYETIPTKVLEDGRFDLKPIQRPSEKDVLSKLLPQMLGKNIRSRAEAHLQTLQ